MIRFEAVSKRFDGGTLAVDNLDLAIEAGELVVLVGPSGCGKTTTLRMINRLEELTEGRISINGQDIMAVDRIALRRGIGYVMQHSGLFPHRTIADNIATMPNLLGWDRTRTRRRVEELIELVGLLPEVATRYPHQLSGGQQQRVGVARALAVDPPLMLMDEPFAAVDPIVRTRLQDQFLQLQKQVNKTIVFVTHDIDEAIKIGDRIAVFETGGSLAQYDTPTDMLAAPANEFVTDFLGPERELKRLALIPVSEIDADPGPVVEPGDSAETAREQARRHRTDWVVVVAPGGRLRGWIRVAELDGATSVADRETHPFEHVVRATDSLRAALNAMVATNIGVAPRMGPDDSYEGLLTQEGLSGQL